MFRRLKWIFIAAAAVIAAGVIVLMVNLDLWVKRAVERQASASLNLATTVRAAHLSLLGGNVTLAELEVASPKGFSADHACTLKAIQVGSSITHLREAPLLVDQITVEQPTLVLEQSGGKFNVQAILDQPSQTPADGAQPLKLVIHMLDVNNAQVILRPGIPGLDKEIKVSLPSFTLKDVGNADNAKNGAAIKQVLGLVLTTMAEKAAASGELPEGVKDLLHFNVDQAVHEVTDQIKQGADQAIQKGLGDLMGKDKKRR